MMKLNQKFILNILIRINLYGKAMSEYLPYGGFKWVKVNDEVIERIKNKSRNS